MGDAILCTPALRAIRRRFESCRISFLARPTVREILSPCGFNDVWLQQESKNPFAIAKVLKRYKFTHAILFKNSFASALAVLLAAIPLRIGYAREGRGIFLTDKLYPPRLPNGRFKPVSMIDYYLAIASWLDCDTDDRTLELLIDPHKNKSLQAKLPEVIDCKGPVVVLVPGGAFGPSKCWPAERFAAIADRLISDCNATVVVSVSPQPDEKRIAEEICRLSKHTLINLAERPVNLGELKALFSTAQLVISNDTGPRHIAIAMGRKVVSLFGPNDPVWTDTGCENEIKLIGDAACAPCGRPICEKKEHLCMQAITVEMVWDAVKKLLENTPCRPTSADRQRFVEISKSFFIDPDYKEALTESGLTSIDTVFSFNAGEDLAKPNLAGHRSRLQFETESPPAVLFLKRYDRPPILAQLKNWLHHRSRRCCAYYDFEPAEKLAAADINTPKTVAYGQQWGRLFEKRSFIITERIPAAESLERRLPDCFNKSATAENLKLRRNFITQLAGFVKRFHETNYRHRDLYFSHIFYGAAGRFYLIDLARAFKPALFAERFRLKDVAQLCYSAPARYFSRTDRLRFYLSYRAAGKLTAEDKVFIGKVINKAKQMARHDVKHGRAVPFAAR
jgi:heptosyltransferase-2